MRTSVALPEGSTQMGVTGPGERNLKLIRDALGVRLTARGGALLMDGESLQVARAQEVVQRLREAAQRGRPMDRTQVLEVLALVSDMGDLELSPASEGKAPALPTLNAESLDVYLPGKTIRPATERQRRYTQAIVAHDLTFCTGPAGTGKTYLAVAAAVSMLKHGLVRRLILSRPAVEAGEKLGFLPGTMQEKVNPYLRPLLDALHDMMDFEKVQRLMAVDVIEVVPLAFMRGRTLNDAMIILDEAQNATKSQMLMCLTRLGQGSKMVVTGDTSQTDLEDPRDSGLVDAIRRLGRVNGVATTSLDRADIVRHRLVQRIVDAYGTQGSPKPPNPPSEPDEPAPGT